MLLDEVDKRGTDAATARTGSLGPVAVTAIGVAAFVVCASAISFFYRQVSEPPYIEVLSEKFEDLAASGDQYDLIFLGTSETFRHVNPAVVDEELAACGLDIRTLNFGVPALQEPEFRYMVERLLAERPERLRYVVVQDPLRAEGQLSNMLSDRGRYFRGWDRLDDTVRDAVCYTGTTAGKARRVVNNAQAVMQEQLGVGRLAQLSFPATGQSESVLRYDERYRDHAGYWPVDEDPNVAWRNEETPMTDEILARAASGEGWAPDDGAAMCRAGQIMDSVDGLRAAGLEVGYYVSPAPNDVPHDLAVTAAVREAAPDMPVFSYVDPVEHPEFLAPGLWFDFGHMRGEGADMLSRKLGADMCAWIKR